MNEIKDYWYTFSNEEFILTLFPTSLHSITLTIENTSESTYWKKELTENSIKELTAKLGHQLALSQFISLLVLALSKENPSVSLSFLSLNEIKAQSVTPQDDISPSDADIKKYLMLNDSQQSPVLYPIQFEYCGKSPEGRYLQRTIERLKATIKNSSCWPEVIELRNKVKILESHRMLGAVDSDNIQLQLIRLKEQYDSCTSLIKALTSTIEGYEEIALGKSKDALPKDSSKEMIKYLEGKLSALKEETTNETISLLHQINERDRKITELNREISLLKDKDRDSQKKMNELAHGANSNHINITYNKNIIPHKSKGDNALASVPNLNSRNKYQFKNKFKSRSNSTPLKNTLAQKSSSMNKQPSSSPAMNNKSFGSMRQMYNSKYQTGSNTQKGRVINLYQRTSHQYAKMYSNYLVNKNSLNGQLSQHNLRTHQDKSLSDNSSRLIQQQPNGLGKKKGALSFSLRSHNANQPQIKQITIKDSKDLPFLLTSAIPIISYDKTAFENKLKMIQRLINKGT